MCYSLGALPHPVVNFTNILRVAIAKKLQSQAIIRGKVYITFVQKSCSLNVGEIVIWSQFHHDAVKAVT